MCQLHVALLDHSILEHGIDLMDTSHWAFEDIVFILKPFEETRQSPPYIVDGCLTYLMFFPVLHQEYADIFRIHDTDVLTAVLHELP